MLRFDNRRQGYRYLRALSTARLPTTERSSIPQLAVPPVRSAAWGRKLAAKAQPSSTPSKHIYTLGMYLNPSLGKRPHARTHACNYAARTQISGTDARTPGMRMDMGMGGGMGGGGMEGGNRWLRLWLDTPGRTHATRGREGGGS